MLPPPSYTTTEPLPRKLVCAIAGRARPPTARAVAASRWRRVKSIVIVCVPEDGGMRADIEDANHARVKTQARCVAHLPKPRTGRHIGCDAMAGSLHEHGLRGSAERDLDHPTGFAVRIR